MTIYRGIISWLAILFLTWRGVLLSSAWFLDKSGIKFIKPASPAAYLLGFSGPDVTDALYGAPFWGLVGLAMVIPWLLPAVFWLSRRKPVPAVGIPFSIKINLAGRWCFALACVGALLSFLPRSLEAFLTLNPTAGEEPAGGYFTSLFSHVFIGLLAAMLIAPEITLIAASGFTGFIDSVFFPGSREKKPPYTLKLARFYVQKQRWDDAEAEYARMLSFYPDRLEAWQESLRVAFAQGENADPAPDAILSKGLKKLKVQSEKEALFATFNAKEKPVIVPEPEDF